MSVVTAHAELRLNMNKTSSRRTLPITVMALLLQVVDLHFMQSVVSRDLLEAHHHTIKDYTILLPLTANPLLYSMHVYQTPVLCNLTLPLLSIAVYTLLITTMQHQEWSNYTNNHSRVHMKTCRQNYSFLQTMVLRESPKQRLCSILSKACTMDTDMPFPMFQNLL